MKKIIIIVLLAAIFCVFAAAEINITLNTPANASYISYNSPINFRYSVTGTNASYNCSLFINQTGDFVLNQTNPTVENFTISNFTVSSLSDGFYKWNVYCSNGSEENWSIENYTFAIDTIVPGVVNVTETQINWSAYAITWNTSETANSIVFYGNVSGNYNWNSSNLTNYGIYHYLLLDNLWHNQSIYYVVNSTDFANNSNKSSEHNFNISYVDLIAPYSTNQNTYPSSGATYNKTNVNYQFNATLLDNINLSTVWIENNFRGTLQNYSVFGNDSSVFFYNITNLPAGIFYWKYYANDTSGNVNSTNNFTYIVNRANSTVNLTIDGIDSNTTANQNTAVNITAYIVDGDHRIEIWNNSVLMNNGTDYISNITTYSLSATYNLTAYYPLSENYSTSYETHYLTVNDSTAPIITINHPANNTIFGEGELIINLTTDDLSTCIYVLNNGTNATINASVSLTHVISPTLDDSSYNITFNCTNNNGLSSVKDLKNVSVDTIEPIISINYPNESGIINSLILNFNYTANDTHLDSVWYVLNYNLTDYSLNSSDSYVNDNETVTLRYPGKQYLEIFANDTAGNVEHTTRSFYAQGELNINTWIIELSNENSRIDHTEISNSTENLSGSVHLFQKLNISIYFENSSFSIMNITANETKWSYFINVTDSDNNFVQRVRNAIGTNPVDYVVVSNMTEFFSDNNDYYGIVKLPKNSTQYEHLYYCNDALTSCSTISVCSGVYSESTDTACYNDMANNTLVYVPHFSSVFGSNDTVAPIINITAPANGANLTSGYQNSLTVTINEEVYCKYMINSSAFSNYTLTPSSTYAQTFDANSTTAASSLFFYQINVTCNDTNGNYNSAVVNFIVNDTSAPNITEWRASSITTSSATLRVTTSEPAVCKYSRGSEEGFASMDYFSSTSYVTSNSKPITSDGTYHAKCQDSRGKEAYKIMTFDFEEEEAAAESGSSSGSSGEGASAAPKKVTSIWDGLAPGEHIMYVSSSEIAVTQVTFTTLNEITTTSLIYVESKSSFTDITQAPPNILFQYIRIGVSGISPINIDKAKIKFKIPLTWFTSNNTDRSFAKLYFFENEAWTELKTDVVDTDSKFVYYTAETKSLSGNFALSAKANPLQQGNTVASQPPANTIINQTTNQPITGNVAQGNKDTITEDAKKDGMIDKIAKEPLYFFMPIIVILIISLIAVFLIYQSKMSVFSDSELKEIREYVQRCESEGIEFNAIRNNLINAGWSHSIVDLVLHDVHLPHENMEKLVKYIEYCAKKDTPKNEIIDNLKRVGWQPEVINDAFKYNKIREQPSHSN
ncbi:MAG: PGF-pre-PGF domain-containing protein [archaeon]